MIRLFVPPPMPGIGASPDEWKAYYVEFNARYDEVRKDTARVTLIWASLFAATCVAGIVGIGVFIWGDLVLQQM